MRNCKEFDFDKRYFYNKINLKTLWKNFIRNKLIQTEYDY